MPTAASSTQQEQSTEVSSEGRNRIWLGAHGPGAQTRLFRRRFSAAAVPAKAWLELFAESRYHVWVNNHYLGRGPAFHHPTRLPMDRYDIAEHLCVGLNVLAVLVQAPDVSFHNHICSGEPGLTARLTMSEDQGGERVIETDAEWRVTDVTGWRSDSPRRCWAIDYLEEFNAASAPHAWQGLEFDDSGWKTPDLHSPATLVPGAGFTTRPIPDLVHRRVGPGKFLGRFTIDQSASPSERFGLSGDLARSIMSASWEASNFGVTQIGDGYRIDGLTPDSGTVLCVDLGHEYVGQVLLNCDCPGPGIIDVGWSEVAMDGRPQILRKGVGYVDRILAVKGPLRWQPIQFSSMRYLVLVLRGFEGSIQIHDWCIRASEPAVSWAGEFRCDDQRLNDIFDMCARSHRVGTQEAQMDCPSREQSAYIGDGMLTARWFAQLTGDTRHWCDLVTEQFRRQSPSGILRAAIFSGRSDTAIDYTLLAVIGVRDYFRYTADLETIRQLIEPCRRAFAFFDKHRQPSGLCNWVFDPNQPMATWENVYDPAQPVFAESEGLYLIIDHPGLGWHNKGDAGIDRRGTNTSLNALLAVAKQALADLEQAVGETGRAEELRRDAATLAALVGRTFFDASRGVFVDGMLDGRQHSQVSEQANTLAIAAGACDDDTARAILQHLLTSTDRSVARNGPYFWAYLMPQLMRLGLHQLALDRTRVLWGRMIDGGASTLWETFAGDDLDSWCHPWAGAPQDLLLSGILGLPGVDASAVSVTLKPRFDLLSQAAGSIVTRQGTYRIRWSRRGDTVELTGTIPVGCDGVLVDPQNRPIASIRGDWNASTTGVVL